MIADLPMYDWPGLRAETDAFWQAVAAALADEGIAAPPRLERCADYSEGWRAPDLLVGQTCGMPFVLGMCGDAQVIARADYRLPHAAGGTYRSVILVRRQDAHTPGPEAVLAHRGRRVAVNAWHSYSGHIALRDHIARLSGGASDPFFGAALPSGSHLASARMVMGGAADLAAVDGVVWALIGRHEPETAGGLAVIGTTDAAPALPFITAARNHALAAAIVRALATAAAAAPAVPGLPKRVVPAGAADYEPIRKAARRAAREAFAPDAPPVPRV